MAYRAGQRQHHGQLASESFEGYSNCGTSIRLYMGQVGGQLLLLLFSFMSAQRRSGFTAWLVELLLSSISAQIQAFTAPELSALST